MQKIVVALIVLCKNLATSKFNFGKPFYKPLYQGVVLYCLFFSFRMRERERVCSSLLTVDTSAWLGRF